MADARTTAPADFDLAEYALEREAGERPTREIPGVVLLTLLAETSREEGDHARIEVVELDPDDVILDDDGSLGMAQECSDEDWEH